MKTSEELINALKVLPDYSENICQEDSVTRLVALSDLYKIYIPSFMSVEIYSKLYLSLIRSLNKKRTKIATIQQNENFKAVLNQEYRGIIGGSDSFTIIGNSGIGKSSAISRAIELITENRVIETENPYSKIIPCVTILWLVLAVLRKLTDMLIGSVSQVALNHIGILIVDEIQNVVNSKNGKSLVGALTQLINNSGISICMVGTPESNIFFEQAMQLARRSLGLQYGAMKYDDAFREFCRTAFKYQYTKNKIEITESIVHWIYEHSGGITSVVVSLIHDAQEIAILNGTEKLDLDNLTEAYKKRLSLLHSYIEPQKSLRNSYRKKEGTNASQIKNVSEGQITHNLMMEILTESKSSQIDVIHLIKDRVQVEEIRI